MKRLILLCLLFCSFCSFQLADRLLKAEKGDFMVTEQEGNYSLLLIKERAKDAILLEEISVPKGAIDPTSINWEDWLYLEAPGHTSWVAYEIHPSSFELMECYSFSQKGWIYLADSEQFLSDLLSLKLRKIPKQERRKIGLASLGGEVDARPVWHPSPLVQGKKTKVPSVAWKGQWKDDGSFLALCTLTVYFSEDDTAPFPLWIEGSNGHFTYAIKTICFGKNLPSFTPASIPRRPPKILKAFQGKEGKKLLLRAPLYYKDLSLYAFDVMNPEHKIGPIPFQIEKGEAKEEKMLTISDKHLAQFLSKSHKYKWVIETQKPEKFIIESDNFFHLTP